MWFGPKYDLVSFKSFKQQDITELGRNFRSCKRISFVWRAKLRLRRTAKHSGRVEQGHRCNSEGSQILAGANRNIEKQHDIFTWHLAASTEIKSHRYQIYGKKHVCIAQRPNRWFQAQSLGEYTKFMSDSAVDKAQRPPIGFWEPTDGAGSAGNWRRPKKRKWSWRRQPGFDRVYGSK